MRQNTVRNHGFQLQQELLALSHSRRVQGLKLGRFTPRPNVLRSPLHSNLGIFLSLAWDSPTDVSPNTYWQQDTGEMGIQTCP